MSLTDWWKPRPDQPQFRHRPVPSLNPRLGTELTSAPLAALHSWTSGIYSVSNLARIELLIEVLEEGELQVEVGEDGSQWQRVEAQSRIRAGSNALWVGLSQPLCRFRYLNGHQDQTLFHFRLFDPRARLRLQHDRHVQLNRGEI